MKRFLITGATGNIGYQVIRFLYQQNTTDQVVAAVRDPKRAKPKLQDFPSLTYATFDFEKPATFQQALQDIDIVFLLRPPHLADINKYFVPLVDAMQAQGVSKVVFLSVQGAENSSIIPHHKIEKLILQRDLDYIFVRPSYFMQNLTTTLLSDIQQKQKIILPAAKARFNWVDVDNIGEVTAILLQQFDNYKNKPYVVTGKEKENYYTIAQMMTKVLGQEITYQNVNPFYFYWVKSKDGMPTGMIMVMIMLHFIPRFTKEPAYSEVYQQLTGKQPTTLQAFLEREKETFVSNE